MSSRERLVPRSPDRGLQLHCGRGTQRKAKSYHQREHIRGRDPLVGRTRRLAGRIR
jgi:hypothetical protein